MRDETRILNRVLLLQSTRQNSKTVNSGDTTAFLAGAAFTAVLAAAPFRLLLLAAKAAASALRCRMRVAPRPPVEEGVPMGPLSSGWASEGEPAAEAALELLLASASPAVVASSSPVPCFASSSARPPPAGHGSWRRRV